MEKPDQEMLDRIKIGKSKIVTERIDSSPYVLPTTDNSRQTIDFGNTGFNIHFESEGNKFNFRPEGRFYPEDEADAPRYATTLGYSLLEVYDLLQSPLKLSEFGINESQINKISAITNTRLTNAIVKLFSRSDIKDIVSVDDNSNVVKIDLQKFKQLKSNDPLIEYLNKISERAKDATVTYEKTITRP